MGNIYRTLVAMSAVLMFASCDNIEESERYIEETVSEEGRKVLVEEFTGQFCINCPDGHEMLDKIRGVYGEKVIAVSIHAGALSSDVEGYGLKTPEGDTYANAFKVQSYPSIVVNRKGVVIDNMAQWQDAVQKGMGQNVDVSLHIDASLSEDGKTISINTEMLSSQTRNANLQIWITESSIVTFQQAMTAMVTDYVHNHVYRASVNGVGGESISLAAREKKSVAHSYAVKNGWNVNNLSIVAFVYDASGVLQVEEIKLDNN